MTGFEGSFYMLKPIQITYINTAKTQMVIDGVIYRADEDTIVKDEDGNIVGLGTFDPIEEGDTVDVDGDVYTIVEE
jgi:hypothetical protein